MVDGVETALRASSLSTGSVPRWLWFLGLFAAILTTLQSVGVIYMGSGWSAPRGSTGIGELAACRSDRFCAFSVIKPNSPADHAGVRPGDQLRLDHYWERHRTASAGDHIGVTVRHAGQERHVDIVTAAKSYYAPTWIFYGLASAAVCLVALLILARAGRQWWSFLLGCSLVSVGIPGGYPRFWENDPTLFPWFFMGLAVIYMAGPVMMLGALRGFRRDVTGKSPRWLDHLMWVSAILVLIATIWGTSVELDSAPILGLSKGLVLTSLTWSVSSLLGPLALVTGWREVPSASRTRYTFMLVAVSVSSIHPLIDPIIITSGGHYAEADWPVVVQLTSTILGAALFAYAILRHRVVDIGFAINRTLVFSALSFLTLTVFGLVEWASEKLLPFESHETNAVIGAAVALTLFLVFHHIHAWIERLVERLFFHNWHDNEASLRHFSHHASYISRAEILIDRTVTELKRFTGGATIGFYRVTANGYALAAGDAKEPAVIDIDTPALVAMRADRTLIRDVVISGDIGLPMTHRAELTGFVVLGPKPSGDPYRADEEMVLAETVSRIGLDLYALRIDELQNENVRLLMQVEMLSVPARRRPAAGAAPRAA